MNEATVRASFARQAEACLKLGSPFTGSLAGLIGERLDHSTTVGRRILDWQGMPDALHDAVALRLIGALHLLVRRGAVPLLARAYPPNAMPARDALWALVEPVLTSEADTIMAMLDNAPQTNETGRSGPVMAGLLTIAAETGLPLSLYELGTSAGLNLNLAHFRYDLAGTALGDPASGVLIQPRWDGPPPPQAEVRIVASRGVDLNPLSVADSDTRERLPAYVWPDQKERLQRVEAAIDIALARPPRIDQADAASWLEQVLVAEAEPGIIRVVFHTIAFQYFPAESQQRIRDHLARIGAQSTADTPLAWLRYEQEGEGPTRLRLSIWPGEQDRLLGEGHPHGTSFRMF